MQMAAPFCIGMLGWYAWYETDRKFWLFDLYFFVGVATLAKGPVAPVMAGCIIFSFAALRREWSLLRRSIWIPGMLLYFAGQGAGHVLWPFFGGTARLVIAAVRQFRADFIKDNVHIGFGALVKFFHDQKLRPATGRLSETPAHELPLFPEKGTSAL